MNTVQMEYFIKAAQLLNFTEAAEQLYVTQPSLSRQIIAIENELNMQLFIRKNNTVQLTQAGNVLYQGLKKVHKSYMDTVSAAKQQTVVLLGFYALVFWRTNCFRRPLRLSCKKCWVKIRISILNFKECLLFSFGRH